MITVFILWEKFRNCVISQKLKCPWISALFLLVNKNLSCIFSFRPALYCIPGRSNSNILRRHTISSLLLLHGTFRIHFPFTSCGYSIRVSPRPKNGDNPFLWRGEQCPIYPSTSLCPPWVKGKKLLDIYEPHVWPPEFDTMKFFCFQHRVLF